MSSYRWPGFREELSRGRAFEAWFRVQEDGRVCRALYAAGALVVMSAVALIAIELAFDIGGYTPRWFVFMTAIGGAISVAAVLKFEVPARRAWELANVYRTPREASG